MLKTTSSFAVLALAIGAIAPASALAQQAAQQAREPAPVALEEVIVTARKREENLQSAPVAVSAFNEKALEAISASTIKDVASVAPNLVATQGPAANTADANFFIRGIGQEDFNTARDPGVGIYLDGVYVSRTAGAALDNLDIQRLEVLRGPQGTLFGRNTIGGAINIETTRPGDEFGGKAQLTVGSRNRIDVKASANVPLSDTLSLGLAATRRTQDGWGRSLVYGVNLGDVDVVSGRVKLAWDPTDNFSALLSIDATRSGGTAPPIISAGTSLFNPNGTRRTSPFGVPLLAGMLAQACSNLYCRDSYASSDPDIRTRTGGAALTLDWDLGDIQLKSITAYRRLRQLSNNDFDSTSFVFYDLQTHMKEWQFSQELQASGVAFDSHLNWVGGLYYFKEETDQRTSIVFGGEENKLTPGAIPNPRYLTTNQWIAPADENLAAYGQATYHITDDLSFTGGLRLTTEKKAIQYNVFLDNTHQGGQLAIVPPGIFFPPLVLPVAIPDKTKRWNPVTWRAGLEYKVTPDVMVYGSAATGFRSGGFNGRPTSAAEATAFDPEEIISYEIGAKTEFFDHRVRLNTAAFYTDYKSIQVLVATGTFFTFQNAKARNQGFEVELLAEPIRPLRLEASAGYLDSAITQSPIASLKAGQPLASSPKWTTHLGVQYTVDMPGGGDLLLRLDQSFVDRAKFYNDSSRLSSSPAYSLLNARVTWESPNRRLRVAAYGTNILDKNYLLSASDNLANFGTTNIQPAPLHEYGVQFSTVF